MQTKKIVKLLFPSPQAVSRQSTKEGHVTSRTTVQRDIAALGLKAYKRPKVPGLSETAVAARVKLAKRLLRCPSAFFDNLIFSDEKWFDTNDAGVQWQYCEKGNQRSELLGRCQYQGGPKVFVWGAISVKWRILVVVKLPETGGMNHRIYIDQCLSQLLKKDLTGMVLVQDGARAHWTPEVRAHLTAHNVDVLQGWVAGSCDMNTIEPVWGRVQRAVSERGPYGVEELTSFITQEFERIPVSSIANHVLSFKKICKQVVEAGGKALL